ncbi:hypothetical protein EXIGLDRAFT_9813 [Exidia glandulosa HHB12029]|uniref:Uncharacterized protein n=1 Tax=Exidia glandulosa HHB12029 TaxID=1314781 RepID=A0A165QR72_EXIGL|nr:hypothetical protein EXIGLDRAFT_9813 [Exidia glandulosa HHB12029]
MSSSRHSSQHRSSRHPSVSVHHSSHHSSSRSGSRHSSQAHDPSHHSSVVRDASRHTSAAPSGLSRPSHTRRRSNSLPARSHAGTGSNLYVGAPSVYNPILQRTRRLSGGLTPSDSISQVASTHRDAPRSASVHHSSRARTMPQSQPMVAYDAPAAAHYPAAPPISHYTAPVSHHAVPMSHHTATAPVPVTVANIAPHMAGTGAPVQYMQATPSTVYHTQHGVSYVPYHSMEVGGQRFTFAYPVNTSNIAPHLSPPGSARGRYNYPTTARSPPRIVQNDFPRAEESSGYSSMSSGSGRIGPRSEAPPMVAHDGGNSVHSSSGSGGNGIWSKVRKMFKTGLNGEDFDRRGEGEHDMADAHSRTVSGSRRSRSVVRSPQYEFRNPGRRNKSR